MTAADAAQMENPDLKDSFFFLVTLLIYKYAAMATVYNFVLHLAKLRVYGIMYLEYTCMHA